MVGETRREEGKKMQGWRGWWVVGAVSVQAGSRGRPRWRGAHCGLERMSGEVHCLEVGAGTSSRARDPRRLEKRRD